MAQVSPPYTRAALAHLRRADPVMARLIEHVGPYRPPCRPERFHSLARAIIFQQLAGRAAQTIHDRFVAAFEGAGFPTPSQVLEAPDEMLRKVGLSRQKTLYIKDLAAHIANDSLNFRRFAKMSDEAIIEHLTMVKGIGRWTAEMFLMFSLWRPDVLPVDDLGVQKAVMRVYRMRKPPTAKRLRLVGERWRPYRSVAVWYLWRSGDTVLPDGAGSTRKR